MSRILNILRLTPSVDDENLGAIVFVIYVFAVSTAIIFAVMAF